MSKNAEMASKPVLEVEPKTNRPTPANHLRDPLMTVKETAVYLRVSKSFLDKARLTGDGPAFLRIGRKILYRRSVVTPGFYGGKSPQPASTPSNSGGSVK